MYSKIKLGSGSLSINHDLVGTANEIYELNADDILEDSSHAVTLSKKLEATPTANFDIPVFRESSLIGDGSRVFCMEYEGTRREQIRKHKKKRINKKWAKRYGYREVPCLYRVENCYIQPSLFNDWTIVSDPPKVTCSTLYGSMKR